MDSGGGRWQKKHNKPEGVDGPAPVPFPKGTSSSVRLWWEFEEPKGPKGP